MPFNFCVQKSCALYPFTTSYVDEKHQWKSRSKLVSGTEKYIFAIKVQILWYYLNISIFSFKTLRETTQS